MYNQSINQSINQSTNQSISMEDYYNTRDNEDCWLFWITYIKVNKIISSSCLVAVFTTIWVAKVTLV